MPTYIEKPKLKKKNRIQIILLDKIDFCFLRSRFLESRAQVLSL